MVNAWDQRRDESDARYRRFRAWLELPRGERLRWFASHSSDERYAKAHDWRLRGAAYDEAVDRDYEINKADHIREVRTWHARTGRQLLELAVGRIEIATDWRPGDLVRLADLARKMELAAVFGNEREMVAAARSAVGQAGGDLDEWDQLAADLAGTMPPR